LRFFAIQPYSDLWRVYT